MKLEYGTKPINITDRPRKANNKKKSAKIRRIGNYCEIEIKDNDIETKNYLLAKGFKVKKKS